jgi:hypothetical protein
MIGLSDSESTLVDAPEKSVGKVQLVSVLRSAGGIRRSCEDSSDESWIWVLRDSVEEDALSAGDGGRHRAHSRGKTCVQRTDFGPCASQKCVRASWKVPVSRVRARLAAIQIAARKHVP